MALEDISPAGKPSLTLEPKVSGAEFADPKADIVNADRQAERELTLRQVIHQHPALIGWTFFYSIAAIGWLVSFALIHHGDSTADS